MSAASLTAYRESALWCAFVGTVLTEDKATKAAGALLGEFSSFLLKRFEPMFLEFSQSKKDASMVPILTATGFK